MPQRILSKLLSVATRPLSRSAVRQAAASTVENLSSDVAPRVENLERRELLSATYFVATSGNDNNTGTLSAPFRTLQRAATVATAGDVVQIETGTYREAVTPTHAGTSSAPITYQAYNGESVTIDAANPVTGWTLVPTSQGGNGHIYKASMPWTLGAGNDEIFVNGQEINQARFPNTTWNLTNPDLGLSHPNFDKATSVKYSGNSVTLYNANLTQPTNYWKGSIVHMELGEQWVAQSGTVTSSAPGHVTVNYSPLGGRGSYPLAGNQFYILGKFQELNTPGTWYRDPTTGELYVWTPTGANPSTLTVEAKARNYTVDLSKVHDVTIQGINLFGGSLHTGYSSSDVTLNHITGSYLGSFQVAANGWWIYPDYGIQFKASHDVLENSVIQYCSGDGVEAGGANEVITNNVIHDVDQFGGDMAGVRVLSNNSVVSHNTVYNTGRDGIECAVSRVQVLNNSVSLAGLQTTEAGGIYTEQQNGGGVATIAYNQLFNIHGGGWGETALFLDQYSSGWVVDNNDVYNVDWGLKFNYTSNNNNVYNNTLIGTLGAIGGDQFGNWNGSKFTNNVLVGLVNSTPGATWKNNLKSTNGAPSGVGAAPAVYGAVGKVGSSAGMVLTPPPVTTPPVTTPPVTTPPVTTPPVTTPPVTTPPVTTPPVTTPPTTSTSMTATASSFVDNYYGHADGFGGVGIYSNGWISYKLNFGTTGVSQVSAKLAARTAGQTVEIRIGSATGTLVGTLGVGTTETWDGYAKRTAKLSQTLTGTQTVYLVFKGPGAWTNMSSVTFS